MTIKLRCSLRFGSQALFAAERLLADGLALPEAHPVDEGLR